MRLIYKLIPLLLVFILSNCINYSNFYSGINYFHNEQYREAFIKLKPIAKCGQPEAQYAIGYMYYYGEGIVENREKAFYWINTAALAGQPEAKKALSIILKSKNNG